ncbi:MAG: hypothetical protein LBU89_10750 [Fibromonadaceae bacterium]|jgi:REP element-mobilizing transposase RayT|nr:hypothetical protein [Fibromonadaceae bacterium]
MRYGPERHNRRSIRLRNYNYANAGAYFVTICLNQRIPKIWRYYANMGRNVVADGRDIVADALRSEGQTHRSAPTRPYACVGNIYFPIFGIIENDVMMLNDCGKMVEKYILEIVNNVDKFLNVEINEYIVMPDHIHAIIKINNAYTTVGADLCVCPCATNICPCATINEQNAIVLGTIIQWLKTMTTNAYTDGIKTQNWRSFNKRLWQRNYYEHIIRTETEYIRIAEYIRRNPVLWRKKHLNRILRC